MKGVLLLNAIGVIVAPEQMVCAAGVATPVGLGLTRTVAVMGVPSQPLSVGVMVKVTVTGAVVVFVRVAVLIFPVPLAAIPVTATVLFLVQLKVVPANPPLNPMGAMAVPEQMVWVEGVATALGIGLTSTVAVIGVPAQPLAVGVMVKVTVTGAVVVFARAPLIFPVPLVAIPVTEAVLFLVQL